MSSHTEPVDDVDIANLAAVHDVFAHLDPLPVDLTDRIKFALTVHSMHAELAELTENALLAARGAEPTTSLTESVTFTSETASLMVTVTRAEDGQRARVDGWVTSGRATVEAWHGATGPSQSVRADDNGRFVLLDVPRGTVHFVIRLAASTGNTRPVVTPTIQI